MFADHERPLFLHAHHPAIHQRRRLLLGTPRPFVASLTRAAQLRLHFHSRPWRRHLPWRVLSRCKTASLNPKTWSRYCSRFLLHQAQIGHRGQQTLLELRSILVRRLEPERFPSAIAGPNTFGAKTSTSTFEAAQAIGQCLDRLTSERKLPPQLLILREAWLRRSLSRPPFSILDSDKELFPSCCQPSSQPQKDHEKFDSLKLRAGKFISPPAPQNLFSQLSTQKKLSTISSPSPCAKPCFLKIRVCRKFARAYGPTMFSVTNTEIKIFPVVDHEGVTEQNRASPSSDAPQVLHRLLDARTIHLVDLLEKIRRNERSFFLMIWP